MKIKQLGTYLKQNVGSENKHLKIIFISMFKSNKKNHYDIHKILLKHIILEMFILYLFQTKNVTYISRYLYRFIRI